MKLVYVLLIGSSVVAQAAEMAGRDNPWKITERGGNHRIWQRVAWKTNEFGEIRGITNSYTELQTGMHFMQDGKWIESEAKIELVPGGASASKGPHQVNFAANINTIGAIDLTTPNNGKIKSHVLGLSYFDTATGKSALIAEIKDSIGVLTPPNQIVYPDAFTDVKADIRYTYTKRGFEQDIILREQPPSPAEYGLNVDSTRLDVLTEFVEAPVPVTTQKFVRDGASDQKLRFGSMSIGSGIAFMMGDGNAPTNNLALGEKSRVQVPVAKEWTQLDGRNFLIESVKFDWIKPNLEKLPKQEAKAKQTKTERAAKLNKAIEKRELPARREARKTNEKLRIASINPKQNGYLIDYSIVNDSADFTFQGDTTYLVSGDVYLSGTTTLEGGAVIKSSESGSIYSEDGLFECQTDSYRPAVFTSADDDSVGEIISGSTGIPDYWVGMAILSGNPVLRNVRFSYGAWPLSLWDSGSSTELTDVQYFHCAIPLNMGSGSATLRNVLMSQSIVPLRGEGSYTISAENVTIDGADPFGMTGPGFPTVSFTNSIVVAVTNLGTATIINNNSLIDTNTVPGLFQTVGAASYYLATNSIYRNVGTTNINADLLTEIRERTTYPPIVISNTTYTNDLALFPQAQRDNDVPDLGYHYPPLDYVFGNVLFANVTVNPGTAVGTFSSLNFRGFSIQPGAQIICEGTPTQLNYIVNYNTVQEQSNTNWVQIDPAPVSFYSGWISGPTTSEPSFRFTAWSMMANIGTHFAAINNNMTSISFRDCQFYNGSMYVEGPSIYLTNNLFHRLNFSIDVVPEVLLKNSTFYGGRLEFINQNSGTWLFKDNLFAYTENVQNYNVTNDFNAFYNASNISPAGASNVVLTNLIFEAGPLGSFYLATNNVQLLNKGSTNANLLTLYHYTTTTNQVKETNSRVDIGFHYMAVNTNGIPSDADSDGIPDYLEDGNGNGSVNSGETDWNSASDMGLKVFIIRPKKNSAIP